MNNPMPLITSSFSITDKRLDPDLATAMIGIEPTEIGLCGTKRRPKSLALLQTSGWSVKLEKERIDDIDDGMSRLLDMLWPKRRQIVEFVRATNFSSGFCSSITINENRPVYRIRPRTLRRLAYFEMDYCMDVFDYS